MPPDRGRPGCPQRRSGTHTDHPAPGAPVLGLHAAPVPPQPLTSTGAAAATGAPPASYAPGLGVVTTTTEARSQRARVVAGPATVGGRSWIARDLTSDRLRTLVLGVLVLVLLIAAARVRAARRRRPANTAYKPASRRRLSSQSADTDR